MAKMTGAKYFADAMVDYGVSHIFFVPAFMLKSFAEMEDLPIARVMTHGEKSAAYMADGYARASGKPGVCMAQMIGASNLAAGLRDAYMAGSPVIAITGGPTPVSRHRHAYQEVDDITQFTCLTKSNLSVDTVGRLPDLLRQSFRMATSGSPGPVHLRIQSHLGQITEAEVELNPLAEKMYSKAPAFRPAPNTNDVKAALDLLLKAQRPIVIAGGGVMRSEAQKELLQFIEKMKIPVATSLNSKSAVADHHPLNVGVPGSYSRDCANRAVHEADLIFFIGSHTGGQVTNNWMFPSTDKPVIQLDIDPAELGRNYPALRLLGDARETIKALTTSLTRYCQAQALDLTERTLQISRFVQRARASHETERRADLHTLSGLLHPEQVVRMLGAIQEPITWVADASYSSIWLVQYIQSLTPGMRILTPRGLAGLGWGFPMALGAKLAAPEKRVICLTGDGGFAHCWAEMETAKRHRIGLTLIVLNNGVLGFQINAEQSRFGTHTSVCHLEPIDHVAIARACGCAGVKVSTLDELQAAIAESSRPEHARSPFLIEVQTDPEAFPPLTAFEPQRKNFSHLA